MEAGNVKKQEDSIIKNSLLNESISSIINFYVRDKSKKAIDINIFDKFLSINIYGDFKEELEFDNRLIKPLFQLCNEAYYVTVIDKVKNTKVIDFSTSEFGVYNERHISTLSADDKTNSISFVIYKSHYKEIEELKDEEKMIALKDYINDKYNDALSYLKIRCFNDILIKSPKNGDLLDEKIIDENFKIQLCKMNRNRKSIEIIINGIKLNKDLTNSMINWNKYPYRQRGYSFRRLNISIYIDIDNLDIDNKNLPRDIIDQCSSYIGELIEENKDSFRKDTVYFNLEYDKDKMQQIVKSTSSQTPVQAVKKILDNYYDSM